MTAPADLSLLERVLKKHGSRKVFGQLSPEQRQALPFLWPLWRRPKQGPPRGRWRHWLIQAGRGFGKTRTASEWIREEINAATQRGERLRIALVAPTPGQVRDLMIEGRSGLLNVFPPYETPKYEPAKGKVRFKGGHVAAVFSAFEPGALRGPEHHVYWAEELAAWKGARGVEAWSNLMFGLRLGHNPRGVITTTPKPVKLVRDLRKLKGLVTTRGSTYENASNLPDAFLEEILARYEGTALAAQEIRGELLEDTPGALWTRARIELTRAMEKPREFFTRVVVAVDPAVTSEEDSDETGIVVAGKGQDGHLYVLADASGHYTPNQWAERVWNCFFAFQADRVVAEVNQGGDLVEATLRTVDGALPVKKVHASIGKRARAEPISALYEQGRAHHVGMFELLEDQLCQFTPETSKSPDRLDALVWAGTELMLKRSPILT